MMMTRHVKDVVDDVRKPGAPFDDRKVHERYSRTTKRNAKTTVNGLSVITPTS